MSTKLWYDEFINDWMWALPLGNGRIGAMQYGNPHCEQFEINDNRSLDKMYKDIEEEGLQPVLNDYLYV